MKCSFCERLNLYRQINQHDTNNDIKRIYTAAIVENTEYKERIRGHSVCYNEYGIGFPLNFCPECGKKLE